MEPNTYAWNLHVLSEMKKAGKCNEKFDNSLLRQEIISLNRSINVKGLVF